MAKLIVFEGVDGSGKSTLAKLVTNLVTELGIKATYGFEPTKTYAEGLKIRSLLETGASVEEMVALFNADREKHQADIRDAEGAYICDRYYFSTIAYQCAIAGIHASEYAKIGIRTDFIAPDAIVLVSADVYECAQRIRSRGTPIQITEDPFYTKAIRCNYSEMFEAPNSIVRKERKALYNWKDSKLFNVENRNGDECSIRRTAENIVSKLSGILVS